MSDRQLLVNFGDTYKIPTTKEEAKNFVHVPEILCTNLIIMRYFR